MKIFKYVKDNTGIPFVFSFILMLYTLGGLPILPTYVMYITYIFGSLYLVSTPSSIDKKWLLFIVYLPISLTLANPNSVFRSWERLLLFVVMFIYSSPLVINQKAIKWREKSLLSVCIICVFLSVISFVCYFVGINLFVDRYNGGYIDDFVGSAGHFSGICNHSMVLGPISGISSIFLFNQTFSCRKKYVYIFLVASLGSLLFSASRSALLASIMGCLIILFLRSESIKGFFKKVIPILIVAIATFPLWDNAATGLISKQKARTDQGGMFDSRTKKILCRYDEFTSSPIYGVGFAAIDPDGLDGYNHTSGTIEPGSSWMAILSMTGIVGFVLFANFIVKTIKGCWHVANTLYLGLLVFFLVDLLVEGYIFAGGSILAFMFWLVVGCCGNQNYKQTKLN